MKIRYSKIFKLFLLLFCAFFAGSSIHSAKNSISASIPASAEGNWGLGFTADGEPPNGNVSCEELSRYNAFYRYPTDDKVIFLTFDCGYENGNTASILDTLKKHNARAAFFVVGHFLESSPEMVKRMEEEGHIVGNHTYNHLDMSRLEKKEDFEKELKDVEDKYQEITGKQLTRFYRPPQGKFNIENLKMASDLGYTTFFWSLAYVDWLQDRQPAKEQAFDKLLNRIHPGAIVLLHSTSSTNAQILDELLKRWETMGYHFEPLTNVKMSKR